MSVTILYHQKCQASLNILPLLKEVTGYEIDYIDLSVDKVEADINIDIVPMLIIDNKDIFKGKQAFDKIEELKKKPNGKMGKKMYRPISIAPEDDSNKKTPVDLGAK